MIKIILKPQKMTRIPLNLKYDQNTLETKKNDQNTPKLKKITEIPSKPRNDITKQNHNSNLDRLRFSTALNFYLSIVGVFFFLFFHLLKRNLTKKK